MSIYFMILTDVGIQALADALASSSTVTITKLGVGDGGGSTPTPVSTDTALVNEKFRTSSMNQVIIDPDDATQVIAEGIIPMDHSIGGDVVSSTAFTIREVGLYINQSGMDVLFATGVFPTLVKPLIIDGSGIDITVRCGLAHANVSSVVLLIDPNVVLVSQTYALATFVKKTGDIMTGALNVPASASGTEVPQVQEVIEKTGGVLTGELVTAGQEYAHVEKIEDFNVVVTDHIIEINAGSSYGNVEGILLDAVTNPGKVLEIKAIDVTNEAKMTPLSGQDIEGLGTGVSFVFTNTNQVLSIYSDGFGWKKRNALTVHTHSEETDGGGALEPSSIVLAGSAWPSFSVHRNGDNTQSLVNNDFTKLRWITEVFDTNSNFTHDADDSGGASENIFTPTVAGKYLINLTVNFGIIADQTAVIVAIYKNGAFCKSVADIAANGVSTISVSVGAIVDADGVTDYFEAFAYQNTGGSININGDIPTTFFEGCRIG